MSINTIQLKVNQSLLVSGSIPFDLSLDESIRYKTPTARQSLSITLSNTSDTNINIDAKDGYIYLTNKRFVFVTASQGDIESFSIDLFFAPSIQFSHSLKLPWFGANYWEFLFFSSSKSGKECDGFLANQWYKGQIKFNDGGLFDFIEIFNAVLNDSVNNKDIDEELPQYSA